MSLGAWNTKDFVTTEIPLLIIVFLSMFLGDFTRNFYDEYSKYARYAAMKAAQQAGAAGSPQGNGADGKGSGNGQHSQEAPPRKPSLFALRLFSLVENPWDMGKVELYGETSVKPRPMILALLGVNWDDGKPVETRPLGPIETPEEIIERLRKKENAGRKKDEVSEDNSIREYLERIKKGMPDDTLQTSEPDMDTGGEK